MAISTVRLIPHLIIIFCANSRGIIKADLSRWAEIFHMKEPRTALEFANLFVMFMTFTPEFRNLFYLRAGMGVRMLFSWMCPRLASLDIAPTIIGPGLFIQHGEGTFVSAVSIGKNCWIGRQVVIGFSNDMDRPTIGDNVRIFAGAKVIGNITIGDNATIGLNTVITQNVLPDATMLGVPGKVIWKAAATPL